MIQLFSIMAPCHYDGIVTVLFGLNGDENLVTVGNVSKQRTLIGMFIETFEINIIINALRK